MEHSKSFYEQTGHKDPKTEKKYWDMLIHTKVMNCEFYAIFTS